MAELGGVGAGVSMGNGVRAMGAREFRCGVGFGSGADAKGAVIQIIAAMAASGATCARLNNHSDRNSRFTAPASARAVMRTAWLLRFAGMWHQ